MFIVLGVLALAVALGVGVYLMWDEVMPKRPQAPMQRGSPTPLLDRRVPGFSLPGVVGPGLEARDLLTARRPRVVKFWGSWSPACIQEYPVLMDLQAARVEMFAIAFRDTRTNALDYLERNGNPYARVALDAAGRVASDWGVTSAPTTFVVDAEGIVRWARSGPLTAQIVSRELMPALERYAI